MRLKTEALRSSGAPRPVSSSDRRADADATTRTLDGPVLVAFDDRHPLGGALRLAEALARRDRVNAHLLGLVRPLAMPAALAIGTDLAAVEDARLLQLKARLQRTLHAAHGVAAYWSTEATLGAAAASLAATARTRRSALLVLGMARIGSPDRIECEDATLQVIRAAPVPVLAVPPSVDRLPRRALVAVDFSPASLRAAKTALLLVDTPAVITLAHVQPDVNFKALGHPGWDAIYESGRDALFAQLTADLMRARGGAVDIGVESVVLHGEPGRALLSLAQEASCDLIAAGTAGLTPLDRAIMGSVSTALLRGARCTVLVAPSPSPRTSAEPEVSR